MESKSGEPETIDVSELMKDLDDDENSPRATSQFSKDPLPRQKMASMASAPRLPADSFAREPSDVTELPQWWSSFHTQSGLGRSAANSTESLMGEFLKYGTARSRGGSVGGSSLHTSELFGDKLCVLPQDALAEHLQKSLSFEASPKKEMESIFRQRDSFDARHGKGLKMADSSGSTTASWLLSENDSALSFSSPSFSSAMSSFKRWFGDDSRTVKGQQDLKAMPKTSGSEAQLPPQKAGPPPSRPKAKMTGPSLNASGASANAWGYANHDEGAVHPFSSSDRDAIYPMPPSSTGRLNKMAQGGGARRHRHSFTSANREQEFLVDRIPHPVNRASSCELEKVVIDPKSKVVFYSTSSQTDVHAYEDSNAVRAILISLVGASFDEKSVSQHPEYEQELKSALNTPTALVPTVYVRGRFIAGVDNILNLYKKGALGSMLSDTLAHGLKPTAPCICRGGKFLICPVCKGKRRLARQGEDSVLCRHCSGTGLIKCPTCLSA